MAKYYGRVGYVVSEEVSPGVWEDIPKEIYYRGDVLKRVTKWQMNGNVIGNVSDGNSVSILADPFAYDNFSKIKYIEWMNDFWYVDSIEVQYPRLILTIGGLYNGPTASRLS